LWVFSALSVCVSKSQFYRDAVERIFIFGKTTSAGLDIYLVIFSLNNGVGCAFFGNLRLKTRMQDGNLVENFTSHKENRFMAVLSFFSLSIKSVFIV
jgi:hypothetical protein